MSSLGALPGRLILFLAPVCVGGLVVVAAAIHDFVTTPQTSGVVAGAAVLLCAFIVAERYPVPLVGADIGGVSLGFVFAISTIVLFGWAAAALVVCAAPMLVQLLEHRPPVRVLFNGSVFAISAGAAGLAIARFEGEGADSLLGQVTGAFAIYYAVNLVLVSSVVALSERRRILALIQDNFVATIVPSSLMASAALMFVVLWERSPFFTAALVGPLVAIALYQRSTHRAVRAMQLALTDPLTGLGNHRHFQERLQHELLNAQATSTPLTLCLIDIDDFKGINDTFGHPAGDRVLSQLAAKLRQGGEGFRLGGDEFAVLLPGLDARDALATATSIVERIAALELDHAGSVSVSAGVATFPSQGVARDELIRLADSALYWAKEHGKNQVRMYRPDVIELAELKRLAAGPDRAARYRAAASLAKAVDARDAYTGSHSERVAELAGRIATRLGIGVEQVELTRLAASLHDLGKLAIPEEILRKPGPLTEPERTVLERHPEIGFRMLESLGVDPVANWVLHHHERWDGSGYPHGLHGQEIPLSARIIFIADAFDAMTSDRVYRSRLSAEEAVAELTRCAGTQFDPQIVTTLATELGVSPDTVGSIAV